MQGHCQKGQTGPTCEPEPQTEYLLRFERLLSGVSSMLMAAPSSEISGRIEEALRALVEFFGVDRSGLGEFSADGRDAFSRITYGRPGVPLPLPLNVSQTETVPWYARELLHGRVVRIARMSELPQEASRERERAQQVGIKAHLAVPVLEAERAARSEAERAIGVRDDFLALAAHELRTPLTSLQLATQALSRSEQAATYAQPTLSPETRSSIVRRYLGTMERQLSRLNLLIEHLLDASQIVAGRLAMVSSEVDLSDVARRVVARLEEPLRASGSRATVDAPEPVVGNWDCARLERVVTSLVANAIKYGAGEPIEVIVRAHPNAARLAVRDHGIGIPAADQARIFGRFERAVPSEHYGGLGLGLYIVQQIAEQLGGNVTCESVPQQGSTFTVTLPRTER